MSIKAPLDPKNDPQYQYRPSNSRHSSVSIFSKAKPPISITELNLPKTSKNQKESIKESINEPSENLDEDPERPEIYQNPLFHLKKHEENAHIPGEFEKPSELDSQYVPEEEFKEEKPAISVFKQPENKSNFTENIKNTKKVEIYNISGKNHLEQITINTPEILEKVNKNVLDIRNSAFPIADNNKQPFLNIMMSPQQQEIYYKMYYLKANTSVGIRELTLMTKRDQKWFSFLEEKADKMKEKLRDESRILNYMIESMIKLTKHYEMNFTELTKQRKKLIKLSELLETRYDFEEKLRFDCDFLRHKLEDFQDLEKEADLLIAIFSTLIDENLRDSAIERFEHKDIHSLALKKYDEYHDFVNKLDLALQEYRRYYRLDYESDEFKRKIQGLLAVLLECDEYSKKTFIEIKVLNRSITQQLQLLIEKLKENNQEFRFFFTDLEDSYNNVCKLIYIRIEKLPIILMKFKEIDSDFSAISFDERQTSQIFSRIDSKVKMLRKELKSLKKQAKGLRNDPKCQMFLLIRFKMAQKLIDELKLATSQSNAFLLIINYLKENLKKEEEHVNKLIKEADFTKKNSEEKNRILSQISSISSSIDKQLCIKDLKRMGIDQLFRQLQYKLSQSYEKLSAFKPVSTEEKRLLSSMQDFISNYKVFLIEFEKNLMNFNDKIDKIDLNNPENLEKNLGFLPLQKKARSLLNEISLIKFDDFSSLKEPFYQENHQEINEAKGFLKNADNFFEIITESLLAIMKLKAQIISLSFQNKEDFTNFEEILMQGLEKLKEIQKAFRFVKQKSPWEKFFEEINEFMKVFKGKIDSLKPFSKGDTESHFEKGLFAFIGLKNLKINRFIQEFAKEWDFRFKSVNEMKSLGSRASTIKELDAKINRKRLLSLNSWLKSEDLTEVFVLKEFLKNSENAKNNKKICEEFEILENNIRDFFENTDDFLNLLDSDEVSNLIIAIKRLFPETQDYELILNIYKKALETEELLKKEQENLGNELNLLDFDLAKALLRFNGEIRDFYEKEKAEIQMILDAIKKKELHTKILKEMKEFFLRIEAQNYENEGVSMGNIADFVEISGFFIRNKDFFMEEMKAIKGKIREFRDKNMDLSENWEFLKEDFMKIQRILQAFMKKEIKELMKSSKKSKEILFFTRFEGIDDIREIISKNFIEFWHQIWQVLLQIVYERKKGNLAYVEMAKDLEKRKNKGEFREIDKNGVLDEFLEIF